MLAGTGSDVGKSILVAGLVRALTNRGFKVKPFKPQNMSNNAAVTSDGGEIGRAQALQARAAKVQPTVHMNPVLLKPQSEIGSQIIVQGKIWGNAKAREYQGLKPKLLGAVLESFDKLAHDADIIVIEGAGSVAEVNLRKGDIANMGFAGAAGVPVILVGDIDRGGVIAQVVGSQVVIAADDAAAIEGFIINKFRGDPSLFNDGMALIADTTGWSAIGLVPFFPRCSDLPPEDAVALQNTSPRQRQSGQRLHIVVTGYPRISNFDDFDPLKLEPGVDLTFLRMGEPIPGDADLVILPGSKATISDLKSFCETGWDVDLTAHVRRGGYVLGICGGYQMLGRTIHDPEGIEGPPTSINGLGLLDVETELTPDKTLTETHGINLLTAAPFRGYEMHVGQTSGPDCDHPLIRTDRNAADGATDKTRRIVGCYIHALFNDDRQRASWLHHLGQPPSDLDYEATVDQTLDALAAHLETHLDIDRLLEIARAPSLKASTS
ncbi:MAG: cobyric acid synthase [Pseudomonadota bacterium]